MFAVMSWCWAPQITWSNLRMAWLGLFWKMIAHWLLSLWWQFVKQVCMYFDNGPKYQTVIYNHLFLWQYLFYRTQNSSKTFHNGAKEFFFELRNLKIFTIASVLILDSNSTCTVVKLNIITHFGCCVSVEVVKNN